MSVLICALAVGASGQEPEAPDWDVDLRIGTPLAPLLSDIDGDREQEIVIVDIEGQMLALEGDTGRGVWRETLSARPRAFTTGVVALDDSFDLFIPDEDGNLHWVDGSTGALIETFDLGSVATAVPSVWDFEGDGRDEILIVTSDPSALLIVGAMAGENSLELRTVVPLVANGGYPAAVGDITGDGADEIAVQSHIGGVSVFTAAGRSLLEWEAPSALSTPLTLVDVIDLAGDEILFATSAGQMVTLSVIEGEEGPELVPNTFQVAQANTRFNLMAAMGESEGIPSTLFLSTPRRLRAFDGLTGHVLWEEAHLRRPSTPTSVAPLDETRCLIAVADTHDQLHLYRFDRPRGEVIARVPAGGRCTFAPLVADFGSDRTADVFILVESDVTYRGRMWSTPESCEAGMALWVTGEGTTSNSGHWRTALRERHQQQVQTFHSDVQGKAILAQRALENGEIEQARELAEQVLHINPRNVIAIDVYEVVTRPERRRRQFLYALLAFAALALLTVGTLGYLKQRRRDRAIADALSGEDWSEVVRLVEPLLAKRPKDTQARRHLARAHIALGRHTEETRPLIEELARLEPTPEHRWALAQCMINLGDRGDEALTLFRELARAGNDDPDLHRALGEALVERGDPARAVGHLRVVLRHSPEDTGVGILLCDAQIQAGKFDETFLQVAGRQTRMGLASHEIMQSLCRAAVELLCVDLPELGTAIGAVLAKCPTDPWALTCRGLREIADESWEAAATSAQQLPADAPTAEHDVPLRALLALDQEGEEAERVLHRLPGKSTHPGLVRHIAVHLARRGRRDDLMRQFGEAAMTDATCPLEVMEALAECLAEAGKHEEQCHVLGRLAEAEPGNERRWMDFGLQCAALGRTDEAACGAYRRVLDAPPVETAALRTLVLACGAAGLRDPRLGELAERLAAESPDDPEIGFLHIRVLLEQGAAAEAHQRGLQIFSELTPGNIQGLEILARAAFEAKDYEHAKMLYERLRQIQPDSSVWLRQTSICLSRLGVHDDEAIALHREVARANPQDPVATMILARALLERGEIEMGIEEVRGTLRDHPDLGPQIVRLLTRLVSTLPPEHADPVRLMLADLLSEQGEFAEAAVHLNALMSASEGDTQSITQKIERLAGQRPDDIDALQALGILFMRRGELTRAQEVIAKARRIDSDNPDLLDMHIDCEKQRLAEEDNSERRMQLGQLLIEAERPDEALSALQPIQDDVFLFRQVRLALSQAYLSKGMLDFSWQELQTVPIDDASKPVFYFLGERFVEDGRPEAGREVWRQLYGSDISYRDIRVRYETLIEEIQHSEKTGVVAQPESSSAMQIGDQLFRERFELEEEVGVGGMGRVYRARDKTLDETVALKILPPQMAANEQIVERLKREVRAARQLTHPNIIRIHDFGALGGQKFISMEFIGGPTLKRMIRTGAGLTAEQRLSITRQMADALAYAHGRGVVHRDIKPANILVTEDDECVKITDFGIAKVISGDSAEKTMTNQILGTPLYMSPEQIRGDQIDGRADVYSFGITLFEMLTGHPPFQEGDLAYQHMTATPKPVEGVSPRLAELVARCLEKAPDNRWPNFNEICEALGDMAEAEFGG